MQNILVAAYPVDLVMALYKDLPEAVERSELLAPMVMHLERTRRAFERWNSRNLYLEASIIREGNVAVRDLLIEKADLIPPDLIEDAKKLIVHYDAWLEKFEQVRSDRTLSENEPFVFVGTDGLPFPSDSAEKFVQRFRDLQSELYDAGPQRFGTR
jgi:hypothetical protein